MTFADDVLRFYRALRLDQKLPRDIEVLNPYVDEATLTVCMLFYQKFYADENTRTLLLGINPGRFGSGTTGISFTDPIQLQKSCGITNEFAKKPELSSDFIYRMIGAYGGPAVFYQDYFVSAVSPLGFTKLGKNINYYDDPKLQKAVTPFIVSSIEQMTKMKIDRSVCFCIGEGKNYTFLRQLNSKYKWFERIKPLAHPRFIMQYKRKQLDAFIAQYIESLRSS